MSIDTNFSLVDYMEDKFDEYGRMPVLQPTVSANPLPNAIFSMEGLQASHFTKTAVRIDSPAQSELNVQRIATNAKIASRDVSGRVDVTISWGDSDGPKTDVTISGSVSDNHGNSVEVSGHRDSDGKGSVSASAEHDKDKDKDK